jgi:hypothetical protein
VSRRRSALAAVLGIAAAMACAAPAAASVAITAKPRLSPAFNPKIRDYVSRCIAGEPVQVSVHASGGDRVGVAGDEPRGGTFERQVKRVSGAELRIRVRTGGASTTYHVRCLPPGFPTWVMDSSGRGQAEYYVLTPIHHRARDYATIVDRHGTPIWWWRGTTFGPADGKLLPDGTIAWTRWYGDHFGVRSKDAYEIRRPDGSLVRLLKTVGSPTDTHDMQPLPNGNYLVDTYRRRCCEDLSSHGGPSHAEVFDGEVQELTPDGRLVWSWSTKGHIPISWLTGDGDTKGWWYQEIHATPKRPPAERAYDVVHLNSVEPDGHGGLIMSARHIDSVFRVDRTTGKIDWKLGGRHVPGKSLKVLGPHPTPLLSGQHDARLWKDGTLTVYDNDTWHRAPSADRFAIDEVKRTARLVERIRDPAITKSKATGSARKLSGGNWVVDWGSNSVITEQNEDGAIVRRLRFTDGRTTYRAIPIEPGQLNPARLRRGMDRMSDTHRGPGASR